MPELEPSLLFAKLYYGQDLLMDDLLPQEVFLRILTEKKHPQIKLQHLRKVGICTVG